MEEPTGGTIAEQNDNVRWLVELTLYECLKDWDESVAKLCLSNDNPGSWRQLDLELSRLARIVREVEERFERWSITNIFYLKMYRQLPLKVIRVNGEYTGDEIQDLLAALFNYRNRHLPNLDLRTLIRRLMNKIELVEAA